jgi:hypothetical protein
MLLSHFPSLKTMPVQPSLDVVSVKESSGQPSDKVFSDEAAMFDASPMADG